LGGLSGAGALPRARLARLSRPRLIKLSAAVVLVIAVAVGLIEGGGAPAEPAVQAFLLAWENGQFQHAAAMTTGQPAVVAADLKSAYRQLDATDLVMKMGAIAQHGDTATAHFDASVNLGSGGLSWSYRGTFGMLRSGSGWKVQWSPSVIVPGLQAGERLAVLTTQPGRAQIEDAAGRPLSRPSPVFTLGVRPGQLRHPQLTADRLAAVTELNAGQIYGQIIAAPSRAFLGLIRLQPAAYRRDRTRLRRIPGLIIRRQRERLFDSIAPALTGAVGTETAAIFREDGVPYRPGSTVGLSGLQSVYQRTLIGSPTTEVVLQNKAGHQVGVLQRWVGGHGTQAATKDTGEGTPVRTTISSRVQLAADAAVAELPGSAAIVAVQPGTGRILATATHRAGHMPAVKPLSGQYVPGQVFTIISTAALLEGGFNANSSYPVPCRVESSVGGGRFTNHPADVGVGAHALFSEDFAHACGTAFAGLSLNLTAKDLASAAKQFGLGSGWRLPLDSYDGAIGQPSGIGQIAAASIGDGSVRVSPLDMALAAGLVESGTWHAPVLVPSSADPPQVPHIASQVVSSLQSLMRATVTTGAGKAASAPGGQVYGQIGNSSLGSAHKGLRSAWFVGYQGKVAFTVVELTKSSNASAAALAGAFLQDLNG
jgi:cell division protein FtsI/penicillin-binding protein 2